MKAVVYKEPYQVAVENVDDPRIEAPGDAVVKITSAAICGSDLHMYEGRTGARDAPARRRARCSATKTWAWSSRSDPA